MRKRKLLHIAGYKIDYNLPVPPRHNSKFGRLSLALSRIPVGASFIVKDKKEAQLAFMAGKKQNIKIEQRQTNRGSIRAWRAS